MPVYGAPKPPAIKIRKVNKLKSRILAQLLLFLVSEMGIHLHFMFSLSRENS